MFVSPKPIRKILKSDPPVVRWPAGGLPVAGVRSGVWWPVAGGVRWPVAGGSGWWPVAVAVAGGRLPVAGGR